jgi:hypothetical protein
MVPLSNGSPRPLVLERPLPKGAADGVLPPATTGFVRPAQLVLTPYPQPVGTAPVIRIVPPGHAVVVGDKVVIDHIDAFAMRYLRKATAATALDLKVEEPSGVSNAQVIFAHEHGQLVGYAVGSRPVKVQPWGERVRRSALAGFPTGEAFGVAQTLLLPPCGPSHRRWLWRIGVVNPNAEWPSPARGPWGTDPEEDLEPLEVSQLFALMQRFGDFFFFPGLPRPEVVPFRKLPERARTMERRIGRLQKKVARALDNPEIGTEEAFLEELLDRGVIRLRDVAEHARTFGIRMRGIEPLLDKEDPRPGLVERDHPDTWDPRGGGED